MASSAGKEHPAVLQPVRKDGALLGFLGGEGLLLAILMAAMLAAVGWYVLGAVRRGRMSGVGAGLLLGGAVGNLVDRVLLGSVRDFLVIGSVVVNTADVAGSPA